MGIAACAPRGYGTDTGPSNATRLAGMAAQPLERLLIPDRSGVSPNDTTVEFSAASGRTIMVRHTPPDNAIFAILEVPGDSSESGRITVSIAVTPGRYGVTISANPGLPVGTRLSFSYAIHFQAPPQVPSATYPTLARFASWLGVVRATSDGSYRFIAHHNPGDDMIRITLPGDGTYLLAAPVSPP